MACTSGVGHAQRCAVPHCRLVQVRLSVDLCPRELGQGSVVSPGCRQAAWQAVQHPHAGPAVRAGPAPSVAITSLAYRSILMLSDIESRRPGMPLPTNLSPAPSASAWRAAKTLVRPYRLTEVCPCDAFRCTLMPQHPAAQAAVLGGTGAPLLARLPLHCRIGAAGQRVPHPGAGFSWLGLPWHEP